MSAERQQPKPVMQQAIPTWCRAVRSRSGQLLICAALALGLSWALLTVNIPVAWGTPEFFTILNTRAVTIAVIAVAVVAQACSTVLFHAVTENRILTPSILGFDALYVLIRTILVAVWGVGSAQFAGVPMLLLQCALMVGGATLLTVWLIVKRRTHLHVLLLVGAVFGIGCSSISNFLQRVLTPNEFEVLSARLYGNIGAADTQFLPIAAAIVCVVAASILLRHRTYDVLGLGRESAVGLGIRVHRELVLAIVLVSVLAAVSVALVGPLTFFGFLIATLAYQWAPADRIGVVLPLAVGIGMVALLGATFVLKHLWSAGGFVTVLIELSGALIFLIVLLKKGSS